MYNCSTYWNTEWLIFSIHCPLRSSNHHTFHIISIIILNDKLVIWKCSALSSSCILPIKFQLRLVFFFLHITDKQPYLVGHISVRVCVIQLLTLSSSALQPGGGSYMKLIGCAFPINSLVHNDYHQCRCTLLIASLCFIYLLFFLILHLHLFFLLLHLFLPLFCLPFLFIPTLKMAYSQCSPRVYGLLKIRYVEIANLP